MGVFSFPFLQTLLSAYNSLRKMFSDTHETVLFVCLDEQTCEQPISHIVIIDNRRKLGLKLNLSRAIES